MSAQQDTVARYIEGFRRQDHAMILACLADDVEWVLHGYRSLAGKEAFDAEISNPAMTGRPELEVHRMIEEGDAVVALGSGRAQFAAGGWLEFVFSDAFFFEAGLIRRLETYQVNLSPAPRPEH